MNQPMLDTNVLVRWLLQDVPAQAALAEQLMASGPSFHVPDAVINELVHVLEKVARMSRDHVAESIQVVISQATIQCNRALYTQVLALYTKHPALSFIDCYLGAYAELNGAAAVYTFDKKMATQLSAAALVK